MHPNAPPQNNPVVWIRPSQIKIRYPLHETDPARLVIDVVQPSRMKLGRLKSETLINLAENGVPHEVLVGLLQEGLEENFAALTNWEGPKAMLDLWHRLATKGGVNAARRAREAPGEARAKGIQKIYHDDEDEDAAEPAEIQPQWLDEVRFFVLSQNPPS